MRLAGNAEISSSMRQRTIVRSGFFPSFTRTKGFGLFPVVGEIFGIKVRKDPITFCQIHDQPSEGNVQISILIATY
jgi:hypothetical protein